MLKLILDVRVADAPHKNDGTEDKNTKKFEKYGHGLKDGRKVLNHSCTLSFNGHTGKSQKKVINCEE
jgi:hypothetical protein